MCGRFALTMELEDLMVLFPWIDFGSVFKPRYNIAPSQEIMAVPVLYSLFIVIISTLVTFYFRRANTAAEQKMPDGLL